MLKYGLSIARMMRSVCCDLGKSTWGVDGADSYIEIRENSVVQVERAVFENRHLDPLQNPEVTQPAIEPVDLMDLLCQPVLVQPASRRETLAGIGDSQVFVAHVLASFGQLLDGGLAVTSKRVAMEIATDRVGL